MKTSVIKAYILDERGDPVVESDINKWIDWMNKARAAGRLKVENTQVEKFVVSTIYTGMSSDDPPRLWETAVFFLDEFDQMNFEKYVYRFNWEGRFEDAKARHDEVVKKVSEAIK